MQFMLLFGVLLSCGCKFRLNFILIFTERHLLSRGITHTYFYILVAVAQANCSKSYYKMIKPKMCLVGEMSTFEFKVKVNVC